MVIDIKPYVNDLNLALINLDIRKIDMITEIIRGCSRKGGYVYTFGNGGSSSTASHFAADLSKGCGVKAICLSDSTPNLTAWANDDDYSNIFSRQLEQNLKPDDVVVAISGSGNSPNVLNGVMIAGKMGCYSIGLTAFNGGKLKELAYLPFVVPVNNMEQAEDIHMVICHIVKTCLLRGEDESSYLVGGTRNPVKAAN